MSNSAEDFLASHGDPRQKPHLEDGATVDGWRVTALLGRGGSGEVYRVVGRDAPIAPAAEHGIGRAVSMKPPPGRAVAPRPPQVAALKILVRDTPTARALLQEQKRISDAAKRIRDIMIGRQKSITNMHEWTEYSKMILQEMTNFHTHIEKTATNHIAR